MDYAFKYAESSPLETESDYPYRGVDGQCSYEQSKAKVKATGFQDVPANKPNQLRAAVEKGPVSVAIQADSVEF